MTPSELIASLQGIKIDAFKQSVLVIVRMVLCPPDRGNLVIKSIVTVLKGQAFSVGVIGNIGG